MESDPVAPLGGRIHELVALMRGAGVPVGTDQVIAAHQAMARMTADSRRERMVLRATLCRSRRDLEALDAAIAAGAATEETAQVPTVAVETRVAGGDTDARDAEEEAELAGEWSAAHVLRHKDFRELDEEELAAVREAVRRLARTVPQRPSMRSRPDQRRGDRLDVAATARRAVRNGGEIAELSWRRPRMRPRPVVAICDASRSMAPYLRPLLEYLQALAAARRRVDAFVFSTRLTRITGELRHRDPDLALRRATAAVVDWEGGTRIGEAIATLNREHGGRLGRGATILLFSDGWDRGDPEELEKEMQRLRRCAHRLIWVNPHAAEPGFEPLTRGLVAALPSADQLRSANTLADFESLVELLAEQT